MLSKHFIDYELQYISVIKINISIFLYLVQCHFGATLKKLPTTL